MKNDIIYIEYYSLFNNSKSVTHWDNVYFKNYEACKSYLLDADFEEIESDIYKSADDDNETFAMLKVLHLRE